MEERLSRLYARGARVDARTATVYGAIAIFSVFSCAVRHESGLINAVYAVGALLWGLATWLAWKSHKHNEEMALVWADIEAREHGR